MNSSEFDRRFEDGESVIDALDQSAARRPTAGSEAHQRRLSARVNPQDQNRTNISALEAT